MVWVSSFHCLWRLFAIADQLLNNTKTTGHPAEYRQNAGEGSPPENAFQYSCLLQIPSAKTFYNFSYRK